MESPLLYLGIACPGRGSLPRVSKSQMPKNQKHTADTVVLDDNPKHKINGHESILSK